MPLQPGQTLNNRYRITGLLRHDAAGAVYLAEDLQRGARPVALQEYLDPSQAAQDQSQGEGASSPRVVDHFVLASGTHYRVMAYAGWDAPPGAAPARSRRPTVVIAAVAVVAVLAVAAAGGWLLSRGSAGGAPGPAVATSAATARAEADALVAASEISPADPRQLAVQLKPGVAAIPKVVRAAAPAYKVGDKQKFWISNSETQEYKVITAQLLYMNDVVAMWVEEGVSYKLSDLQASADRFAQKTYPKDREFFGSEWTPGVDGDPRLQILHARGLGKHIAAYYSPPDEYPQQVNQYSNEREMFYVSADADAAMPNEDFYDGSLAHEFQHMIHWNADPNETSWVNEGMSVLASDLNGFALGGEDRAYADWPDTQLTAWADPSSEAAHRHYGAAHLFMRYFLDRFGQDLVRAVVASPKHGIAGFNDVLKKAGRPERFDGLFADWIAANYVNAPAADSAGRYGYKNLHLNPMDLAQEYSRYPVDGKATVSQYGVDYIKLDGQAPVTIHFEGQTQAPLVPAPPQGRYSWWSNRGDASNSTLTRAVDLRNTAAPKLQFSAWYDLEDGWDYGYVEASTDGGQKWQILSGKHTTGKNTTGTAFGPGWTGASGGSTPQWVEEEVDLSAYAGKQILLRFQVVTDAAVNKAGLLIDNLRIPEAHWQDDVEAGPGDWQAAGWVRTDNVVGEHWLVQLIETGSSGLTVERLEVGPNGVGDLRIANMAKLDQVIMAVSALAPVTTEPAEYSYGISSD